MANYNGLEMVGYKFKPTDEELISYFLYKKVIAREPLMEPHNRIMHEFNLLGETKPWVVWEQFGGPHHKNEDLYFFSQVKILCAKGSRIKRKIESGGTWTQKNPYTEVLDEENGNPIGRKRKFRYHNEGCEHDGMWFLDEYSIYASDESNQQDSKIVLFRLRKKNKYCRTKESNPTQELEQKPKNKQGRESKEMESKIERPKMDIIDDKGPQNASLVVFEECNIKRNSDNNQHQEFIMSGTNNDDGMLNSLSVDGHQDNMMMSIDLASGLVCFSHGGAADEKYVIKFDELVGTWLEELPEIAETKVLPLPTSGVSVDHGVSKWF